MECKEFYKKVNKYIKEMKKEELTDFINNILRKIPESKFEEILCMINMDHTYLSDIEIKNRINKYKEKFKKIEEGNLYFYAEQYEDYSCGWDNWNIEYFDKDNLGNTIEEAVEYAVNLVNHKEYNYAKEIFDMILETNYQAFDEDMREIFEISLLDIRAYELISVNISMLCLYIIYVTYQVSNNKSEDIYNYFKNNPNFINISIEESFKLGIEKLTNLDDFYLEWIDFLSRIKGDVEYRLLREALIYTDYEGYEKYINQITKNQPKVYIDIFNYLRDENKINELIDLGNKALKTIDNNSKIGSDIALYLANIDTKNKEYYICEAFKFNTNVLNLLRIINNGYYEKYKDEIKNKIIYSNAEKNEETNIVDKETYYLLQFFTGNFETFYNECVKNKKLLGWTNSFEKTSVYLWLLLLNENNKMTKCYSKIISDIFSDIGYSEEKNQLLNTNIDEVWKKWKSNFKIDRIIKTKVIKWLKLLIENRVDAIMERNYRKSYYKAALLVVAYGELILSQNLGTKEEYIRYFTNKYSRRSAFKYELNALI